MYKIFAVTILNIIPLTERTFQWQMLTFFRKSSSVRSWVSAIQILCSIFPLSTFFSPSSFFPDFFLDFGVNPLTFARKENGCKTFCSLYDFAVNSDSLYICSARLFSPSSTCRTWRHHRTLLSSRSGLQRDLDVFVSFGRHLLKYPSTKTNTEMSWSWKKS